MPDHDIAPEVAIWTDNLRSGLVAAILERMGPRIHVTALGHGHPASLAKASLAPTAQSFDDFRRMINDRPAGYLLLATMEGVRHDDLAAVMSTGAAVLAIEPMHDSLDSIGVRHNINTPGVGNSSTARHANGESDFDRDSASDPAAVARSDSRDGSGETSGGGGGLIDVPAFRTCPGITAMPTPRELIGEPRQLHIEQLGAEADGSLWARLCDAWTTALSMVEMPETIDASLVGPLTSIPADPRGLTGHLSAHGRSAGSAAITLAISDRSPMHVRSVRLLTQSGRALVDDRAFEMFDASGQLIDHGPTTSLAPSAASSPVAHLIAETWRKLLDHPALLHAWPRGPEPAHVVACALASHLSARTRQPESPAQILQMHQRT